MSEQYSHRNGENVPPTKIGYYWYGGLDVLDQEVSENGVLYFMVHDNTATDTFLNFKGVEELPGQWWGPVDPPWKDDA